MVLMGSLTANALLGARSPAAALPTGLTLAVGALLWTAWRQGSLEAGRLPCMMGLLVCAALVAACVGLASPGRRLVLRDHYEPPITLEGQTSPLSTLRLFAGELRNATVLTVEGLPHGTPVRLAVLDDFDGTVWNVSPSASRYRRTAGRVADMPRERRSRQDLQDQPFQATFTIGEGLEGIWLPVAGNLEWVDIQGKVSTVKQRGHVYANAEADAAMLSGGMERGLRYRVRGTLPHEWPEATIDQAQAGTLSQPDARHVPDEVTRLAAQLAANRGTDDVASADRSDGGTARIMADWLSEHGWFSHGLDAEHPSLPGHGSRRIADLLDGGIMVGDSEQYASAMALMARCLGLPSRVVVGFMPPESAADDADARQEADDSEITHFTGDDAEAWVEVYLDTLGWVAFRPTPPKTKAPSDALEQASSDEQTLVRQPPMPLADQLREEYQPQDGASVGGVDAQPTPEPRHRPQWVIWTVRVVAVSTPLWIAAMGCAMILMIKAAAIARARRRGGPGRRVQAGWLAVTVAAQQCGVRMGVGMGRHRQAETIAHVLPAHAGMVKQLAAMADKAAFSGIEVSEREATACWRMSDALREAMLASLSRHRRWKARLSLHGVRALLAGTLSGPTCTRRSHIKRDPALSLRKGAGSG